MARGFLMPERGKFFETFHLVLDHLALARQKLSDSPAKGRIGDPVSAVGRHRQIPALDLVRALRAGLDALQSAGDRELDRLVIAALEMKEFVIAVAAPIAAVDRILAEQVKRAGNVVDAAPGQEEYDPFRHPFANHPEKAAI